MAIWPPRAGTAQWALIALIKVRFERLNEDVMSRQVSEYIDSHSHRFEIRGRAFGKVWMSLITRDNGSVDE